MIDPVVEPCAYCGKTLPRHRPKNRGCRVCYLEKTREYNAAARAKKKEEQPRGKVIDPAAWPPIAQMLTRPIR